MNKNIAKPLIIQFTQPETEPVLKKSQKSVFVPVNTPWAAFRDNVLPMVQDPTYDSVLVHAKDDIDRDMKGVVGNMTIKINALSSIASRTGKPVLTYDTPDKPFYLANPDKNDMKAAGLYAPSDETIMAKYNSYESDDKWQEHQGKIWARMKDMMPLTRKSDDFNRDHAAQLKDPKRGLEEKDLDKFWSFKSRKGLSPTVMGDDMVGMPSVEGREYEGFTMSINQPDGTVAVKPLKVRSLMTIGASGIAIPMANANGDVNKHQIAADLTAYGTVLHFRAEDGKTVTKGELFDKKTREYSFKFQDGTDTHLTITNVNNKNVITMKDVHGLFFVQPKKEISDVLKERGYDIPQIITSVKAEQNGKYMWQSPGTMTGSDEVLKTVSPSNPGFIKAREPKNGEDSYVVLVAEGALKGHIVAKYIDVKDKEGICFGDKIAGDKGIIVTQVPGVAKAYVKNAVPIYDKYKVAGTYIAMDADGRENRNVAMGIHSAYEYISEYNPTTVLSWDPAQKGMDDALLAVAQGKITVKDMNLVSGHPDALFPIEQAHVMTPYKLDGTQTSTPSWVQEYNEDKKERIKKVADAQAQTAARENKEETWMQTPENISNIQNAAITKSAEMADAMNGKLPPAKQETRLEPTSDVDEVMIDKYEKKEEPSMEIISDEDRQAIRKWDVGNPAMKPIPVQTGYKAEYTYKQPVVETGVSGPLFKNMHYNQMGDRWGVVEIKVESEMPIIVKSEMQDMLKQNNMKSVGNMRLTSQTFTLDQDMEKVEDLGDALKL